MTEGSDTERFSTWIANWQVTAHKNETGLSPVVWNINYLFGNFYVGQVTHLTTPRTTPAIVVKTIVVETSYRYYSYGYYSYKYYSHKNYSYGYYCNCREL